MGLQRHKSNNKREIISQKPSHLATQKNITEGEVQPKMGQGLKHIKPIKSPKPKERAKIEVSPINLVKIKPQCFQKNETH